MKKQLIILWIGIGLVVLAILFPPFWHMGYDFIFSSHRSIDFTRLAAEILIIGLLTAGALYTNRVASEETKRGIKLVIKILAWGVVVIVLCVVTLICVFRVINWHAKKTDPYAGIAVKWDQPKIDPYAGLGTIETQKPRVYKTIQEAAKQGDLAAVKICLQKGVEADAKDFEYQPTPLMEAADGGHLDVVKFLVEKGADMNAMKHGSTPLGWAVKKGYLDVVEFLKQHGAK